MKRCSKCDTAKDDTEFGKDKRSSDGLTSICKECRRAANKAYWAKNGRKYAKGGEKERTHAPETPDARIKRKLYVSANRETINARQREYYRQHKEERRQYYEKTRDVRLARRREYCKRNMASLTVKAKQYAEMYPERMQAAKAVREAIKRKQIRPARKCKCVDCGRKAQHLHHESYAPEAWLYVIPLCRSCHKKRHIMSKEV
jgi:hypothetical protein